MRTRSAAPPEVVRALRRSLSREMLTRYPEYEQSRKTLAKYFGVSPEEMVLTNGTDDAIKIICDTFVDPGRNPAGSRADLSRLRILPQGRRRADRAYSL